MLFLSIALVVIAVLFLIDKNRVWKQSAKVALIIVALGVLGFGGFYAWRKYRNWKEEKAEAAAQAAHDAAVKACIAKYENSSAEVVDGINGGFGQRLLKLTWQDRCEEDPYWIVVPPSYDCFDRKTGKLAQKLETVPTGCGPDEFQKPKGKCKQLSRTDQTGCGFSNTYELQ